MNARPLILTLGILVWMGLLPETETYAVEYDHQQDVVYIYKDGMALVMDVFTPSGERNGAGVIRVMAGGMRSNPVFSHGAAERPNVRALLDAGYTVFAAAHSSQPKYTIEEIRSDLPRAVRFIRHGAERFGVDPQRLGIMGGSSGGQMALLAAMSPTSGDPEAQDPVDRESSELQAVVAHFPGTDNLNFGAENTTILEHFHSQGYNVDAAFDFHQWDDKVRRFERVTDTELQRKFLRQNSPVTYVTEGDPPTLLIHGDKDTLVPLQQSRLLAARLGEAGVPHKLIVAEGKGHGWKTPLENESVEILDWFGKHLLGSGN